MTCDQCELMRDGHNYTHSVSISRLRWATWEAIRAMGSRSTTVQQAGAIRYHMVSVCRCPHPGVNALYACTANDGSEAMQGHVLHCTPRNQLS
jgi:hypothetical protein